VSEALRRRRLICQGAVQGVGFRPFVYRLARELTLAGGVRNSPEGVVIEVEGPESAVRAFVERLPRELPALARLDRLDQEPAEPRGEGRFVVRASEAGQRSGALVPPDAAVCSACRADMEDPGDRRHRYPFTTCTDCGPRFSLVRDLPYDRERTAMACFPLCAACRGEYEDPGDRRFHAEPVCCPRCGPRLWLVGRDAGRRAEGTEALEAARRSLGDGEVVAIKGIGGFQLACRADDPRPVGRLRERKRGSTKPFAVMAADLPAALRIVRLSDEEQALLASARGPILLAPRRRTGAIAEEVAPGLEDLGVMVPTTPVHVELFRGAPFEALVMTSGNAREEPICRGNREAIERLAPFADALLLHDRDVVRRVDDSVVRTGPAGPFVVRRARGYVPQPLPLPVAAPRPLLALGAHLQVTACLAVGEQAFPSQHVGDLDSEPARGFLEEVVDGLERFLEVSAETIVVDAHPDYPSAWRGRELARARGARLIEVQHHLAHVAAGLGEAGRFPAAGERAGGIALDGTGYGPDGTAWGGEWLLLDGDLRWRRAGSLQPFPLIGGEQAVREPWRVAVALLEAAGAGELIERTPLAARVDGARLDAVRELARRAEDAPWPRASGAGRLLEAAGALLGLAVTNGWEGEAAARLEALASQSAEPGGAERAWEEVALGEDAAGRPQLPSAPLMAAAASRLVAGEAPEQVARGLHGTFCRLAVELTRRAFPPGVSAIGVGGGCLVNRWLRQGLADGLTGDGRVPCLPREVPPGDGGLSYGQAVLAAAAEHRHTAPAEDVA
jgi:hydrogenase maturation protein HypF